MHAMLQFALSVSAHVYLCKAGSKDASLVQRVPSQDVVDRLESKIVELSAALDRENELRKSERASRIALQQRARDDKVQRGMDSGFPYAPIGTVRSPFSKRCGTPRQPILCPAAKGKICFNKRTIQAEHFQELKDFSHIWVTGRILPIRFELMFCVR